MKQLKSLLSSLIVLCMLLAQISVSADASDSSSLQKVQILNKFSIIKGDGNDYNLGGRLKRSEAAAIVVRLMGKESYVQSNSDRYNVQSFPDVKKGEWYTPYISFCSEQKLIGGYPDGNFGPNDYISEKAFLKLLLGVLGYTYGQDYIWSGLYPQAYMAGLVSGGKYEYDSADDTYYNREKAFNAIYNSLSANLKGQNITLTRQLIIKNTVQRDIAITSGLYKDDPVSAIISATATKQDKLTIKFNESIKPLDIKNIKVYDASNKDNALNITIESLMDNTLVLTTSPQVIDKDYKVEITNVEDADGNVVSTLTSGFKGYRVSEIKSDFFKISKIEPKSKNVINVYFTQPINSTAELPAYYEIMQGDSSFVKGGFDTIAAKTLGTCDNGISLYIRSRTFTEGTDYTLKVNGSLSSLYTCKLNDGVGDSISFKGSGSVNEDLIVTNISVLNPKIIMVSFNREVDSSSAQSFSNYALKGQNGSPMTISRIILDGTTGGRSRNVRIGTPNLLEPDKIYGLTINSVYDGFRLTRMADNTFYFNGSTAAKTDFKILNAAAIDNRTLAVYFDRFLDPAAATSLGFYNITGNDSGFVSTPRIFYDYVNSPSVVKLFTGAGELMSARSYKLKVLKVLPDEMGNTPINDAELNFTGNSTPSIKAFITEALIIGNDTIKLRFSSEITSAGMNVAPINYTLYYDDNGNTKFINPAAVSYLDATTLILKFDNLSYTKKYTLKFTSINDAAGNMRSDLDGTTRVDVRVGDFTKN